MKISNAILGLIIFMINGCAAPTTKIVSDTKNTTQNSQTASNSENTQICNDSSVACANLKKNQTISATLPDEKNNTTMTLKFNESLTLSGKLIPSYSDICKLPVSNRIEFYQNFYFINEDGKIKLQGNGNKKVGIDSKFSCDDTSITFLQFYDLGNLKIADIKDVTTTDYQENLYISEGHSYAIEDYSGYVDFAAAKIDSYIYVEKITNEGVTVTLNSGG